MQKDYLYARKIDYRGVLMVNKDSRVVREIEEFVLVNNEKQSPYMEKDVVIRVIGKGKNGTIAEVVNKDNVRIGIIGEDNKFQFDKNYKENLQKKMGPYFKELKLDSKDFDVVIHEKIEEKKRDDEERQNKIRQAEEIERAKKLNEENKENKKDVKNMENERKIDNKNNKQNDEKEKNYMNEKELEQYPNAKIKDYEYAKQLVPNLNEQDFFEVRVVWMDKGPQLMVKEHNEDKFVEIPAYMGARTQYGEMDNIDHGEERENEKMGKVLTIRNRNGELVTLDVQMSVDELEIRDVSDLDRDGDREGVQIRTETYKPAHPEASKVQEEKEQDGTLDERDKEKLGIETDENRVLNNEEIEDILSHEDDDVREEVEDRLKDKEVTKKELDKLIEDVEFDIEYVPGYGEHQRRH